MKTTSQKPDLFLGMLSTFIAAIKATNTASTVTLPSTNKGFAVSSTASDQHVPATIVSVSLVFWLGLFVVVVFVRCWLPHAHARLHRERAFTTWEGKQLMRMGEGGVVDDESKIQKCDKTTLHT